MRLWFPPFIFLVPNELVISNFFLLVLSSVFSSSLLHIIDMSSIAEGKRNENHVIWHHKQTNIYSHSNSMSRPQTDGVWLSSPHKNVSQRLFQDSTEECKSVCAWPVLSGCSTPQSSKLMNDLVPGPLDEGRKSEVATSYRLFGIDLVNHSSSLPPIEKATAQPISVSSGITEGHILSTVSAADSDQKSEISKEKKPEQLLVSPKEIQSRQSCSTSTRSRTKV